MRTLTLTNLYIARLTTIVGIACAVCVFLYAFFLLGAVSHTASRSDAGRAVLALNSSLASLQSEYLTHSQSITPALAQELGYTEPIARSEVYARSSSSLLTLHTQ